MNTAHEDEKGGDELVIDLTGGLVLRRFRQEDAESIAIHANSRAVARNLRLRFPHPYRIEDARFFIDHVATAEGADIFAIVYEGAAVGVCGIQPLDDIYARTAELGYWLGEEVMGRGLATRIVATLVARVFREYPEIIRVQARVFSGNDASMRVLEKNGFALEAIHKKAVTRFAETRDELVYVRFREITGPDSVPPPG